MRKAMLIAIVGGLALLFAGTSPLNAGGPKENMCPKDQHSVCYDEDAHECECVADDPHRFSGCRKCPCYMACGATLCRIC
jgi:hypothetical protein